MPLRLNGATSGYVQLAAPAVAGSTSLVLPTDSVQPGLVLVATSSFTTAATVSVDNCFTATYENYRIVIVGTQSGAANLLMRLRLAGTDASGGSDYFYTLFRGSGASTLSNDNTLGYWQIDPVSGTGLKTASIDVFSPAVAAVTGFSCVSANFSTAGVGITGGRHALATAYDGFTIYPASGTITGTLRVYGYRNSITT